jgi:MoaA/NifB/PqqE/SkfB family radical SAM enzyme
VYRRLRTGVRLLRNVVATRLGRPRPIAALWELTYRCNMGCAFCNEKNLVSEELDTGQALAMIDQLAQLGTSVLLLTGGEPTLRRDFSTIMGAVAKSGIGSVLCTNGSNVLRKLDAVLKADLIRISVDGYGDAHDTIRAAPGSFDRVRQAVPRLVREGHRPMLVTVVTRNATRQNLRALLEQARQWGVQVDLSMVVYSLRTEPNARNLTLITDIQKNSRLPSRDFLDLLHELETDYPDVVANPRFYKKLISGGGLGKRCRALDVSINIKPDGRVSLPCDAFGLEHLAGDMRQVWAKMNGMHEMKNKLGEYGFCKDCYNRCIAFPSLLLDFENLTDLLGAYFPTLARQRSGPFARAGVRLE